MTQPQVRRPNPPRAPRRPSKLQRRASVIAFRELLKARGAF